MARFESHVIQKAIIAAIRQWPKNVRVVEMLTYERTINSVARLPEWQGTPAGRGFVGPRKQFTIETTMHRMKSNDLEAEMVRVGNELIAPHMKALDIQYMVVLGVTREVNSNLLWMGVRLDPGLVEQHKWSA